MPPTCSCGTLFWFSACSSAAILAVYHLGLLPFLRPRPRRILRMNSQVVIEVSCIVAI